MHLKSRAAIILAIAATVVGLFVGASAGASGVSVTQTVTDQWTSGYQATVAVRDGTYTVRNADWDARLPASVGFGANGTPGPPTNCTFNGTPCSFGSGSTGTSTSSTSTSTSTTVPSTTTSTTAPGGVLGGTPPFTVAPYADATLWPTVDLPTLARADGVRTYTLGFIVNGQGSCRATWGTYYNLDDNRMADQVDALRSMGGDVIVSFGGAANQELAQVCTTVDALTAQ